MLSGSKKSYWVVWLEAPQRYFFFFFDLQTFKASLPDSIVNKRLLTLSMLKENYLALGLQKKIIHKNIGPFETVSIQDCVCPFGMVYIRNRVHSGWCPFGMVYIRDGVHRNCVFRVRGHSGNCPDTILFMCSSIHQRLYSCADVFTSYHVH